MAQSANFPADHDTNKASILSPPYWQNEHASLTRSRASSGAAGQISLVDNTDDVSQTRACWARAVRIHDYIVVHGMFGKIGSYVLFNCVIEVDNVS
jgi:hypothetical protein